MKIKREDLLRDLESVNCGRSEREIIEQSSCFVFSNKNIQTFNDEIYCIHKTSLNLEGAVIGAQLLALLRKLQDTVIDVYAEDGKMIIKGRGRKASISMESDIVLPVKVVEKPKTWNKLAKGFTEAVKIIKGCASSDESMFALTCIHITPDFIEAMDNSQAARYKIKTGFKTSILVRRSSLNQITEMDIESFAETKKWIHFKTSNGLMISSRKYVEEYNDLAPLFKVKGKPISLPKGLKEAAEKAQIFADDDDQEVTVQIRPKKGGMLRVIGSNSTGEYWEVKGAKYKGPSLEFRIHPDMLGQIASKYENCIVNPTRLKATGPNFVYIAALHADEKEKD